MPVAFVPNAGFTCAQCRLLSGIRYKKQSNLIHIAIPLNTARLQFKGITHKQNKQNIGAILTDRILPIYFFFSIN